MSTIDPAKFIEMHKDTDPFVELRADGNWLVMGCPKFGLCTVPVTTGPAGNDAARGGQRVWHWDGDAEYPTISPSIGCDEAPRCGQHRVITKGKF